MSLSPTRLRRRSFLNDPPGYSPDLPGHSILLSCQDREPSPKPSFLSRRSSKSNKSPKQPQTQADVIAAKAATGSVSFAPLPVIPPELKRRSSITLGVAARKNLLSSPEDEIYPDPRKAAAAAGGVNGKPAANGAVRSVYMNDQEWEDYKRRHATNNGEVIDLGELVTNQAKNFWRKVKPSPTQQKTDLPPDSSPTTSTSSGGMFGGLTSPKTGSSPGSSNGILGAFSSPRLSMGRRRSDPGAAYSAPPGATTTKSPELPKVEEESLSRRESAEPKVASPSPTSPKFMDWEKKPRSTSMDSIEQSPSVPTPPSAKSPHGPPSPPPRVQDVLPSEDEVKDNVLALETGAESDDEFKDAEDVEDREDTLGLEKVEIQSEAGDHHGHGGHTQYTSGRDSAVLGFDRNRFGGE